MRGEKPTLLAMSGGILTCDYPGFLRLEWGDARHLIGDAGVAFCHSAQVRHWSSDSDAVLAATAAPQVLQAFARRVCRIQRSIEQMKFYQTCCALNIGRFFSRALPPNDRL